MLAQNVAQNVEQAVPTCPSRAGSETDLCFRNSMSTILLDKKMEVSYDIRFVN